MRGFVKGYTVWIYHDETPVNVVEPREENMEGEQSYIDRFMLDLDAEVMRAHGRAAEDEADVNDGGACVGDEADGNNGAGLEGTKVMGIIWRKCLGHWTRGDT